MSKIKPTLLQKSPIDIGYDKRSGRFIAYNLCSGIFAVGVTVTDAKELYKKLFYEKFINEGDDILEYQD